MLLNMIKIICIVFWVVMPCSWLGIKLHGAASKGSIIIISGTCENVKSHSVVLLSDNVRMIKSIRIG
jgi:hypothetical protein